ncbi:unnamed protein product, partial [Heterotrigona itama]
FVLNFLNFIDVRFGRGCPDLISVGDNESNAGYIEFEFNASVLSLLFFTTRGYILWSAGHANCDLLCIAGASHVILDQDDSQVSDRRGS